MARAYVTDAADPDLRRLRDSDTAWRQDLPLIRRITEEERQAEEDRAFAASLAGVALDGVSDDRRNMAMLLEDFDDDDEDQSKNTQNQSKAKKCVICMESARKTDPCMPCSHAYCMECLKKLFKASMQDETLMPPRCCTQEIPVTLAKLTPKEIEDFNAKRLEFLTPNRLYCSKPTCSTFIPPTHIVNSVGTCPKNRCGATTCSICKAASHGNADCPKDEATIAVLATADAEGWTRCCRCRAMVELTQGCYHMTCRCRAEFCYLCSVPWKNCACVQWNEERLYEEARVLTARTRPAQGTEANNGINLVQRIERMANQLRANYECEHTQGWVYTSGGGRCDHCHHYLPQYLYRCSGCQSMACNRCRRNRL